MDKMISGKFDPKQNELSSYPFMAATFFVLSRIVAERPAVDDRAFGIFATHSSQSTQQRVSSVVFYYTAQSAEKQEI